MFCKEHVSKQNLYNMKKACLKKLQMKTINKRYEVEYKKQKNYYKFK